ncbi:MAG: hotdog fold domain-containing protein [Gammaproteobacteria bacterium]
MKHHAQEDDDMPQQPSSATSSALTRLRRGWQLLHNKPGGSWLFSRILGFMVPYSGTMKARVLRLEPGYAKVRLDDRRKVRNHLNSIHAIALANLGELASGLSLLMSLPDNVRGIVTGLNIEYIKKARGDLMAEGRCNLPAVSEDMDIVAYADIKDSEGELVARISVDWRVGPVAQV